ncbi:MAG: SIS domain-containing protein [Chlorobi bacterium]|nr:SIS domain-containing protein [Chlorobiota bacterium]
MQTNRSYLGIEEEKLNALNAYHTAKEIYLQPKLWEKTYDLLGAQKEALENFLTPVLSKENLGVVLTGAGTSAYIGEALEGVFMDYLRVAARAVPTTHIVTHPEKYFLRRQPTLLVSFARSGDSPESVSAVQLANEVCGEIYHLIITCNPDGELAKNHSGENSFVFLLPPEADDQSLAMTGSFSSMLLTGILIARLKEFDKLSRQVDSLSKLGENFFEKYLPSLKEISEIDFNRAVFLGSGLFSGIARESHLKLQELTDGKVICKHDTFLGFRHGPKAVINNKTLVVYLFSNNPYSLNYEKDLVKAVKNGRKGIFNLGVMAQNVEDVQLDEKVIFSEDNEKLDEEFAALLAVLPAQTLGFFKSLYYGLKPDNPSESGAITRVVEGVKIYPYKKIVNERAF